MTLPSLVRYKPQQGAALLLFMLLLVLASSYTLLSKLNVAAKPHTRELVTSRALSEAKQALISYAINFPEIDASSGSDKINGPGYLPCPDINNNGSAGGTCSLAGSTTIGRVPWETLRMNDLKDSSGQRLWYVLSDNYRNSAGLEPLNSETPGQLTLDGVGDIVAIIIAPGAPVGNQNRDLLEFDIPDEIANYLEAENADIAAAFDVDFVTSNAGDFNDKIIAITRQELMSMVEKRVLGEVNQVLANYSSTYSAFPWLSPFQDPKTIEKRLAGEHSGSDDQTTSLTDSSADFTQWGVANGDVVWNITDGSYGIVSGVTQTVLTIGGLMSLGSENDFDINDEYFIDVAPSTVFVGTATVGSSNLDLRDSTKDFVAIGIKVGDIVDVEDGSSGIVEEVSTTQVTVKALTGTGDNTFDSTDNYRIRTSMGRATVGSANLVLVDNDLNVNNNFTVKGIQAGDLIHNITDDSYGTITAVTANSLTVDELRFGTNNTFSNTDYYVLPRFNSTSSTREGHLGFNETGEFLESTFNINWGALESDGATVSINTTGSYSNYDNSIKRFAQTSSETVETVSIDDGSCVWITAKIVECRGSYAHASMQGRVTSGAGGGSNSFTDDTKHYNNMGVNLGDIVLNYDDEVTVITGMAEAGSSGMTLIDAGAFTTLTTADQYNLIVENDDLTGKAQGVLSELIDTSTLKVVAYDGENVPVTFNDGDNYTISAARRVVVRSVTDSDTLSINRLTLQQDFDTGEFYGIKSATAKTTSRTVDSNGGLTLNDSGANFQTKGIQAGDIVHNTTDDAWGEIATVTDENTLTVTELYASDSSTRVFNAGETYEVYYSYVNSRRYNFTLRFSGLAIAQNSSGIRTRDVCLGYTNCTGSPSNVSLPYYDLGISSTATSGAGLTLSDTTKNFLRYGVQQGDTVFNITDGSNGIIDTVSTNQVTVFSLTGGTNNVFSSGESYRISRPMVTVQDYDNNNNLVGSATVTIPNGSSLGSINVTGLDYGLDQLGIDLNNNADYTDTGDVRPDISSWMINNDWHKLLYFSYSAGYQPGAGAVCGGVNPSCLTLNDAPSSTQNTNVRALAIIAGMETNKILDSGCVTQGAVAQDRTKGTINEYFESENCNQTVDLFQEQIKASDFNDQVLVIETP
jgi:hypothetical protein